MADVKIKKIEIKIDKKTITLSLEQAKELKAALDDLFQQPTTFWYYPPQPLFPQPYYEWSYTAGGVAKDDGTIKLNIQAT